jgi:hypothetical protein
MTQTIAHFLFSFMLYNMAFIIFLLFAILVIHFLLPHEILERYFKPPYFREFECQFFSGIPYAPIRTVMFMRVIGFPSSGVVRSLTEVYLLAPPWLRVSSKFVILGLYLSGVLTVVFLVGTGLLYLFG